MAKKSTKAETKRRVKAISNLMINGAARADIVRYSADNWQVGERQAENYITEAYKGFRETSAFSVDDQVGIAIDRLSRLYMYHLEAKQHRDALSVQKELNKLLGLYAPEKRELSTPDGKPLEVNHNFDPSKMTDEQLRKLASE